MKVQHSNPFIVKAVELVTEKLAAQIPIKDDESSKSKTEQLSPEDEKEILLHVWQPYAKVYVAGILRGLMLASHFYSVFDEERINRVCADFAEDLHARSGLGGETAEKAMNIAKATLLETLTSSQILMCKGQPHLIRRTSEGLHIT